MLDRAHERQRSSRIHVFRQFSAGFCSSVCGGGSPLTGLTKKDKEWVWPDNEKGAFDTFKKAIGSITLLYMVDPKLPFVIQTDASDRGCWGSPVSKAR